MQSIKVFTKDLAAKLAENRVIHEQDYKAALAGYRTLMREACQKMLAEANEDKDVFNRVETKPRHHLKEYDRAIAMCGATTDPELVLLVQDFDRFWLDEWEWTSSTKAMYSSYSERAGTASNDINPR